MTKKEIVADIADKVGLTHVDTKEIVQATFEAIIDAIATEGRIELRDFGVFEVRQRAARTARNPRTGAAVEVPAKRVVAFKPGRAHGGARCRREVVASRYPARLSARTHFKEPS